MMILILKFATQCVKFLSVEMGFEILGKNVTMLGMMEMAATITAMSKMDSPASGMSVKRQFVLKLVVMGSISLNKAVTTGVFQGALRIVQ